MKRIRFLILSVVACSSFTLLAQTPGVAACSRARNAALMAEWSTGCDSLILRPS